MVPFEFQPRTRVLFGTASLERLGRVARELGARRALLVSDRRRRAGRPRRDAHARFSRPPASTCSLFQGFGANPDSAMVEAGRAFAAPLGIDTIVARRRRQLARLRQGHQLPADQRRRDGRLPRLRQSQDAAAADDRRADHGRHRQRGAELRGDRRRDDAHEDGVRRSVGGVPRRAARSRAHAQRAAPA